MSINGALGVLVHFHIPPSYPITEISNAMGLILDCADEDADVIFGTTTDENMADNSVRVTIVATGFENKIEAAKELKALNTNQESVRKERILRMKKVSGGYEGQDDYLDIPTYIRHQMD